MKNLIILTSLLLVMAFTFSCGNADQNSENKDTTIIDLQKTTTDTQKTTIDAQKTTTDAQNTTSDGSLTVTAKFVDAGSLEGDADLTFKKEDGSKIVFYRNYMDPKEPELKYEFIGEDGASPNPKLVGQAFVIKYKINPKGRISMVSGKGEPCNQILSVEKK
jgi:hypothetical protein